MNNDVQLIKSGFPLIDQKWGGIYRGGTYLIIGPRKSGKTLLGLKLANEAIQQNEKCLYFTTIRPKDLIINATTIDFNIQKYMNNNSIIVVRVTKPNEIYDVNNPDEILKEYLHKITRISELYKPKRIIFDELTPYVGYNRLDLLENTFSTMLEEVENKNITSFFVLSEPASVRSNKIVTVLSDNVTATIFLKKSEKKIIGQYQTGTAILNPNVGHTEGEFKSKYWIEPRKGIVVKEDNLKKEEFIEKELEEVSNKIFENNFNSSLLSIINEYKLEDFKLILNNQIAFYRTTGQGFQLLLFKINPETKQNRLLSIDLLKNLISLSIKKRDKLCVIDDKILILLIKSSDESINEMLIKFQDIISSVESINLMKLLDFISVANIEVGHSIENADSLLEFALSDDQNTVFQSFVNYFKEKS